jgi:hypothetical protein
MTTPCNGYAVQVGAEIPMDSREADEENKQAGGKTLLYVFERGCEDVLLPGNDIVFRISMIL